MLIKPFFLNSSSCSLKEGLDFVKEAIERTGYNEKIKISIGVAATEFCIGNDRKFVLSDTLISTKNYMILLDISMGDL